MEMYNAKMVKIGENFLLELTLKSTILNISLTEDQPNEIKSTFNQLILGLKVEHFNFTLNDVDTDLFSQIAKEYISHLNKELTTIHSELAHHGLLQTSVETKLI